MSRFRPRAEWSGARELHLIRGALGFAGNDYFRRNALLHPAFDRRIHIVIGVSARNAILAERAHARSSAAVFHARDHEQANERIRVFRAHFGTDRFVVVDGILGWNRGVGPVL